MNIIKADIEAVIIISIYTIILIPDSAGKTRKLKMDSSSKVSDTISSGRRILIGINCFNLPIKDITNAR